MARAALQTGENERRPDRPGQPAAPELWVGLDLELRLSTADCCGSGSGNIPTLVQNAQTDARFDEHLV
jgi:hypothetical protein